jgi:hypothetical protein
MLRNFGLFLRLFREKAASRLGFALDSDGPLIA